MSQCNSFSTVLLSIALPWKYCSLNEYLSLICFPFWLGTIRVPMTRQSMFFPLAKLLIHVFIAQPGRWVMVSNQAAKSNRWAEFHRKEDTEVIKLRRKGSHSHFILVKFCTIFKTVTEFSWLMIPMHCQRMVRSCYIYSEWREGILREKQHLLWNYFILESPTKPHKGIGPDRRRACYTSTLAVSTLIN